MKKSWGDAFLDALGIFTLGAVIVGAIAVIAAIIIAWPPTLILMGIFAALVVGARYAPAAKNAYVTRTHDTDPKIFNK
jgi:hypothetical protein